MAVAQQQKPNAAQAEKQKVNLAQAEIHRCLRDLEFLSRHCPSHDIYIDRRLKELINAGNGDLEVLRTTLWQLKHDFDHLAVATANSTACMRRDSLARMLETL